MGDHEGTAGDRPKRRLGSGIGLSRSRQSLSNRDAVSRAKALTIWICDLAGANSFVMARWSWRFGAAPKGMHQWQIVIRTDLFLPTPTMIAVQVRICAARANR